MFTNDYGMFRILDPTPSALEFSFSATLFTIVMLLAYRWRAIPARLERLVPRFPRVDTSGRLILLAVILTILAVPLRFAVNVPALGVLASFLGVGSAAIACGLAGWIWAPRLFNPAFAGIAGMILLANLVIVMTGEFGRRNLLAVFGCTLWGMYYAHWRFLPTRKLITYGALIGSAPAIFLMLYTSVRSAGEHDRSAAQHVQAMFSGGNLKNGAMMMLDGQATGPAALWVIENYPENRAYRPLFTPFYAVALVVPRVLWPEKPEPLSTQVADIANISGVNKDRVKLTVGVIGAAAGEGGWYAVILYAVLFGLFIRTFDEIAQGQIDNPFVVLPVGSALGQILGLARGDTSAFANTYFITTVGSLGIMFFLAKLFRTDRAASALAYPDESTLPEHDDAELRADVPDFALDHAWRDDHAH
jgi:hypothetical protein